MRGLALAVLAASLLAEPARAQNIAQATGQIHGIVTDPSGAPLQRAKVTAAGASVVGPWTALTGEDGAYRFPVLPFGTYRIEVALAGFANAATEGLVLKIGQTLRADFRMSPGFTQSLDVTAAAVIDVATRANDRHLSSDLLMSLPRDRSFETLAFVLPGVNRETQAGGQGTGDVGTERSLSIQGASASENSYLVDGVETTNTQNGLAAQEIVFEFIDEIQVKAGGFNAEYGGGLGGLVNIATRSGGNSFKGGLTFQYTGDRLSAGPRPALNLTPDNRGFVYTSQDDDRFDQYDFGFHLGGPVKKDRLWFFAGLLPQLAKTRRDVLFTREGRQPFTRAVRREFAMAKLTLRASDALKVSLAYDHSPLHDQGVLPTQGTLPSAPRFDWDGVAGTYDADSLTMGLDWVANPRWVLQGFAGNYFLRGAEGVARATRVSFMQSNQVFPDIPEALQGPAGFANVPPNLGDLDRTQRRPTLGASATAFFRKAGQHALKVGIQYASPRTNVDRRQTGGAFVLHWDQSDAGQRGRYGFYRQRLVSVKGLVDSSTTALFVQDAWQAARRLTLHLGLRGEREVLHTESPLFASPVVLRFGFGEKLAPRLGFAWDAAGDGRWKVFGSTGAFYDTLKHNLARIAFAGTSFVDDYHALDGFDWTRLDEATPAALGPLFRTVVLNRPEQAPVDAGLRPTRTWEAALGAEKQVGRSTTLGFRYTFKTLQNMIHVLHVDPTGAGVGTDTVVNPGRGLAEFPYGRAFPRMPAFTRRYHGLELSLDRRFAERWSASASYSWSRLRGTSDGLASADVAGQVLLPNAGDNCEFLEGCFTDAGRVDDGPLSLDRPHQWKLYGAYRSPFGLTAGAFFQFVSGTPYEPFADVNTAPGVRVRFVHIGGRASSGRSDPLMQTNLYLEHALKLGRARHLALFANVINLFDQHEGTDLFQALYLGAISVPRQVFFQGFDHAATAAAQRQGRDPRFGQPVRFQDPRRVRIGVRLAF